MAAASGTSMQVDLELKKAFQELQSKLIATTQQLKVSDAQIDSLNRQVQHSKLVLSEVSSLPDETNMYHGLGRMFIRKPKSEITNLIEEKQKSNNTKIKAIENQKTYLQNSMKEAENSLRELIMSKQKR